MPKYQQDVCKFFRQPRGCYHGDQCRFKHSEDRVETYQYSRHDPEEVDARESRVKTDSRHVTSLPDVRDSTEIADYRLQQRPKSRDTSKQRYEKQGDAQGSRYHSTDMRKESREWRRFTRDPERDRDTTEVNNNAREEQRIDFSNERVTRHSESRDMNYTHRERRSSRDSGVGEWERLPARVKSKNLCRYFNKGPGCWKGDRCTFVHATDEPLQSSEKSSLHDSSYTNNARGQRNGSLDRFSDFELDHDSYPQLPSAINGHHSENIRKDSNDSSNSSKDHSSNTSKEFASILFGSPQNGYASTDEYSNCSDDSNPDFSGHVTCKECNWTLHERNAKRAHDKFLKHLIESFKQCDEKHVSVFNHGIFREKMNSPCLICKRLTMDTPWDLFLHYVERSKDGSKKAKEHEAILLCVAVHFMSRGSYCACGSCTPAESEHKFLFLVANTLSMDRDGEQNERLLEKYYYPSMCERFSNMIINDATNSKDMQQGKRLPLRI